LFFFWFCESREDMHAKERKRITDVLQADTSCGWVHTQNSRKLKPFILDKTKNLCDKIDQSASMLK